jgi:ABC-2 type transport system ATP-binding protein
MEVTEYLDFFGACYKIPAAQREKTVADVLELVGLSEKKGSLIGALSRGMQQRLGLARVLIHDPQLLLLDEPASGLDPRARIEMMAILQELQRMGKTIIISSHILSELQSLCNRCAIIERGQLIYSGPIKGVKVGATEARAFWVRVAGAPEASRELLLQRPETQDVESAEGRLKVVLKDSDDDGGFIAETLVRGGQRVLEIREDELGLEEVFLRVTKGDTQ